MHCTFCLTYFAFNFYSSQSEKTVTFQVLSNRPRHITRALVFVVVWVFFFVLFFCCPVIDSRKHISRTKCKWDCYGKSDLLCNLIWSWLCKVIAWTFLTQLGGYWDNIDLSNHNIRGTRKTFSLSSFRPGFCHLAVIDVCSLVLNNTNNSASTPSVVT